MKSSSTEPVAWDVAEQVAGKVAGRTEVSIDWATLRGLVTDFQEVTAQAEALVEESTGLRSLVGPAKAQVATREEWIHSNITSFRRLLGPVLERVGKSGRSLPGFLGPVGRAAAGAEMGVVLGWMSGRVLGQYDLLFTEGDDSEDAVYFVGPNIVSLERRHGFNPREFRLWIALHELTHRAQFTGVPWLRSYFLELVERSIAIASPDPRQLIEALGRMAVDIRYGRNPLAESGLVGALASPEQLDTLRSIQGMMSLLEGHGDVTMDRAAAKLVPSAAQFSHVLRARRESASGVTKFFQQLIGLEAKLRQYADGERFVREIERDGGPELLALAWKRPENLPSAAEIQAPDLWVSRAAGSRPKAGVSSPFSERLSAAAAPLIGRCSFPEPGETTPCAVSGGPDSLALLALAVAADCVAVAHHVDHGLRAGSEQDVEAVHEAAAVLGVEVVVHRVRVAPGPNLEARAREARLQVLPARAATGHSADDQAETVLLNLLRGASTDGLGAMRPGPQHPILGLRRSETHGLCSALGLRTVTDPTNTDPAYLRNRVRHELIPVLCELAGRDVVPILARQAKLLAEDASLLGELAAALDPTDARRLAGAPSPLSRRAVREWLRAGHPPDLATVERVLSVASGAVLAADVGAGRSVRRSQGILRLESPPEPLTGPVRS